MNLVGVLAVSEFLVCGSTAGSSLQSDIFAVRSPVDLPRITLTYMYTYSPQCVDPILPFGGANERGQAIKSPEVVIPVVVVVAVSAEAAVAAALEQRHHTLSRQLMRRKKKGNEAKNPTRNQWNAAWSTA